jgi:DNA-binding MarR family transcriptional regulator
MTAPLRDPAPEPAGAPPSYTLEDQVGYLLRRAHQRASGIFNAAMAAQKVTPTQFAALAKLDDCGIVSQNVLGRMTAMDPATIGGVVRRLIERGLVRYSLDPNDGRLILLELTESGRETVHAMKTLGLGVSAATLEPLSGDEAAQFLTLLRRLAG